ncbi:hypothetical protein PLESTF_000423200 [Pleodorina starrii]|nr:hypothetical protein PLESTM_001460600 [Pleodorina starrii]GLC66398.1 hypothetical protein PLESTF_000423200 [Pleodorina starrii]
MVLLRFLSRLCASGAEATETCNKQTTYSAPLVCAVQAVEQPACGQHEFAVSSLHRLLSGLTGTSFQRIDGLLEALLRPEITGATVVEFYVVPEGEEDEDDLSLILLGSATPAAKHLEARTGANHLLPDLQQAAIFKQMCHEKAPIHAVVDRCSDFPHTAPAGPRPTPSSAASAAGSAPRNPRRMRVAAVPLLHGSKLAGALWLEHGAATAAACGGGGGADAPPPPLLSDLRALHSLGFACSMCMLGPEGSHAAWLAAAMARLGASDCMSALTAHLCVAVATHVRRRYVLESNVTAALVPPGPEAPVALLLQPSAPSAEGRGGTGAGGGSASQLPHSYGNGQHQPNGGGSVHAGGFGAAGMEMARSGEGLVDRRGGSVGGGRLSVVCRSPPVGRPTSSNVMLFAAQQLGGATAPTGTAAGATGVGQPAQELGGSLSAAASKRRLRALAGTPTGGLPRDPHAALFHARFSLDLSPRTRGVGAPADISRSPSLGPCAGVTATASSRSIIVPLNHNQNATANGDSCGTPQAAAAAAVAAAAYCSGTPTLQARAFPLHRTLLLAHWQQQQHHSQPQQGRQPARMGGGAGAVASAPETGARGITAAAGVQSISAPAVSGVIEDTQLHVQNVHKPSVDVCMLMGLTRKTANGMLGGGAATAAAVASGFRTSASATGMVGGGGSPPAPGGCAAATAGPGAGVGAGVPQSLVLLAMHLGEGAMLGLYLCFPRRLPGPLLEAVRASCQELLDKALAPVVRAKLTDPAIAPEYETLCCASPGSYAVVRSPSCGSQMMQPTLLPPALSAAYMSTATCSDLGVAVAMAAVGGAEAAAGAGGAAATPPELLSGELSTADMEVLLALQAQQQAAQAQGQGRGGGGGGQGAAGLADLSVKRGSTTTRRSGQDRALAAASFVRRSITAANAAAGAPAARAVHFPSPQSPRSTGTHERRALTASSLGPLAVGGGGGAAAAAGGGECVEPLNLSQLLQSNPTDLLTPAARTGSLRSLGGVEPGLVAAGGGGGGLGGGGGGGNFTAASIITVLGVDNAASARQQLDLLVSSIHATISTDPAAGGGGVSSSPLDDLDALELGDVLGQGGGGTVFKGRLGTLDVAVKLMELPKVDATTDAAAAAAGPRKQPAVQGSPQTAGGAGGGGGSGGAGGTPTEAELAAVDKLCLNARREMLRNATELAVQSRVSHPNIVQIYATYNDVVMVSKKGPPGCPGSTYRLYPAVLNSAGPGEDANGRERRHVPCVAAAFELCDCGSLGSALAARTFPKAAYRERERDADGAFPLRPQLVVDMKGVYMTLLDVALALRHLHSLNLVHRDIKPANLLLKSNPRDHRGFTVKLADFGFVLHLSEAADDGSRYAIADQACGTVTHMAPEALLAKAKIDASVDVYAFGILMWEMFSGGVRPFPRLQPDKIPRAVYRGARPTFSDEVPSAYRNLALACWSTDPHRRPRASDVVSLLNGLLQELEA